MPRNAKLDIEQDQSHVQSYSINQAENAAQWNEIGSLMFSSGSPSKLIMRNAPGEQCSEPPCFWVADAFRLTWAGEKCSPSPNIQKQDAQTTGVPEKQDAQASSLAKETTTAG